MNGPLAPCRSLGVLQLPAIWASAGLARVVLGLALGLAAQVVSHERAFAQGACFEQVSLGFRLPLLEVKPGQSVAYYQNIIRPDAPTLVLLPGLFDGFYRHSLITKLLEYRGINVVALHLSVSPATVSSRAMREMKPVDPSGISLEDMADQVRVAVQKLGIRYPVPVSLSYTTSLTQHFRRTDFPFAVDVAPIGRADLGLDPNVKTASDIWSSWMGLFPGGRAVADAVRRSGLETYYRDDSKRVISRFSLPEDLNAKAERELLNSFVAMSVAAKDFDLRQLDFQNGPYRMFVLGAKESPSLMTIQMEAAQKAQAAWGLQQAPAVVIPESGHIIPVDQPIALAAVLEGMVLTAQKVMNTPQGPATPPPAAP